MTNGPRDGAPLASFVLRVTGRPAILSYELHDLRTGTKRRFTRAEALAAFLREQGLAIEMPSMPAPAGADDSG
jgi:hypothetical protein